MKHFSFLLLFIFNIIQTTVSQTWIRTYGGNIANFTNRIFEHYDKGYVLSGERWAGNTYFGWVVKTDVNGFERWSKSYGFPNKLVDFYGAKPISDGGIIEIGVTNKFNSDCTDPIIIKLNPCGEKEWCKIYNAPNCNCGGLDIVTTNDGGYIALIDHWTNNQQKLIWLFRLDSIGGVIWSQTYATDTVFVDEWSHSLLKTIDNNIVITAQTYYHDSTLPPNNYIQKILLIKVNMNGVAIFTTPWGVNNGVICDARNSTADLNENIFTIGRRARTVFPGGDSPTLFKTNSNGQPIFYKDLKSDSFQGEAGTVNWFQDSSMVMCARWISQSGIDTTALIKTNSVGNFIKQKALVFNTGTNLSASTITYNNKILICGGIENQTIGWQTYAFKLNSNLDYDSIYTTPFTYDSLCPHPIVSDTISLNDCQTVIVGLYDPVTNPGKTKLHIFPNPTTDRATIELPQYIVRKNENSGIIATTTYYQWDQTRLDVFDITGKLMFTEEIPQQKFIVDIITFSWPAGMYCARLVFKNEVVADERFIIKHQ